MLGPRAASESMWFLAQHMVGERCVDGHTVPGHPPAPASQWQRPGQDRLLTCPESVPPPPHTLLVLRTLGTERAEEGNTCRCARGCRDAHDRHVPSCFQRVRCLSAVPSHPARQPALSSLCPPRSLPCGSSMMGFICLVCSTQSLQLQRFPWRV